jgi:hypothetical protein
MAAAAQVEQIVKLFIGYFNRAPAPGGTNYWVGRLEGSAENPAMTWAEIAESFSVQSETIKLYPIMETRDFSKESISVFLNSVFQNLFGRDIKEQGLDYYSGQLTSGISTIGEIILDITNGAVKGGSDKARLDNKVAVSVDFFNKTDAIDGFIFDEDARAVATDLLKTVTDDPDTVAPSLAKTSTYIDSLGGSQPGSTINLTSNIDLPGGDGGGTDTQGTENDDTYAATFEATGDGTLQNSDSIAAGGGTDTLNLRVVSLNGSETIAPGATDLEQVVVANQASSGEFIFNFVGIEGETDVTAKDTGTGVVTAFTNLEMGTNIRLVDVAGGGETFVNFKGDISGTDDSFKLFIQDSGTEDQSTRFLIVNQNVDAIDRNMEVAHVETSGSTASFLNFDGLTLDTLMITGDQQLNVEDTTDAFQTLKTVDASGMTGGGVNLDARENTTTSFAFTGSGFDDSIMLNSALFRNTNTLSLDAGVGTDTLIIDSFNNVSAAFINQANGFEVLQASSSTTRLDASDYTKINIFSFAGQTGNNNRINITGVTSDDLFVFESNVGRSDETLRFAADTVGQSLKFELKADSDSEVRILFDTNSGDSRSAVGFDNISSVEIVSSGSNANANVIRGVASGSDNAFAFNNQNGPNNFTISGSQALTITAEVGVDLTASDNERGFDSEVNLDGSNATGALRIAGSSSADDIKGGTDNDIINGLGGDDSLTGNGGSDQFRFSNWSGTDKIQDFTAGEDKIGLQRVDFENTNETSEGTTLDTSDYVQNLQAVANLSNAESNKLVELQLVATSDQITQTAVAATNTYLLVFNETSGKGELWFDSDWSTTSGRTMTASLENITDLTGLVGLTNTDFVEYTF